MRPPRALPAALFVAGTGGLALSSSIRSVAGLPDDAVPAVVAIVIVLFVMSGVGLVLGIATISSWIGTCVSARAGSPAPLIAARRLAAAPYNSSRANAVILLVVMVGGAAQGVRANFLVSTDPTDNFYLDTLNLVNLALLVAVVLAAAGAFVHTADTVVSSRQTLAALTAAGVPRAVLRRSLLLESLLPLASAAVLAGGSGMLAVRGTLGTYDTVSHGTVRHEVIEVIPIPIPWIEMLLLIAAVLVTTTLMAWAALTLVRRSTDPSELRTTG